MELRRGLYWVVTGLLAVFMLMASVPDVLRATQAIEVFDRLGYPSYLLPFLGTAKCLGVLAVLLPRFPRVTEWAFAGLTFDLLGALYSHLSVGDPVGVWFFPVIGLTLVTAAYAAYRGQTVAASAVVASRAEDDEGPRLHAAVARDLLAQRLRRH